MTPANYRSALPIRLVDVAVLNDIERYYNQHGERLGLGPGDLYGVIRAVTRSVAVAESAWEALEEIPGVSGDVSRQDSWRGDHTRFVLQLARAELFGRAATVAIDVRLRPISG